MANLVCHAFCDFFLVFFTPFPSLFFHCFDILSSFHSSQGQQLFSLLFSASVHIFFGQFCISFSIFFCQVRPAPLAVSFPSVLHIFLDLLLAIVYIPSSVSNWSQEIFGFLCWGGSGDCCLIDKRIPFLTEDICYKNCNLYITLTTQKAASIKYN